MKVIDYKDFEAVSPVFKGEWGHRLAGLVMKIVAIDKVNLVYDRSGIYKGAEFAKNLLHDLGASYVIGHPERLSHLPEGAFITVSNHPYGGLDGIIMVDLMAAIRPDYKFMVNKILSHVKTMEENFISVTPVGNKKVKITAETINGIRETLNRLKEGHPIGFFPSGAVSDFSIKDWYIRDRAWQKSILGLIQSAKVPIMPIRFFDTNSFLFYFLGLINWRIRLLRMPHELFNKRDHDIRIGIGNLISVEEQEQYP
ncbi:MAG TPA: 1-acyl-sn-glycerol-3-phosphate acyltransferase, partial [Prolixibacteraceae bacterium]|nr:1-acyl-sn-glycerol-3-phosphate acyltransferase [Prolixibacteraceae bacterium]